MVAPNDGEGTVRGAMDAAEQVKTTPAPGKVVPLHQKRLPENCPVTPLGIDGKLFFYLDAARQLQALTAKDHQRLGILALFGDYASRLYETWPRHDKDGNVTGWKPEVAAEALVGACFMQGVWNPLERVRGPGGWADDAGALYLHCGDVILKVHKGITTTLQPGHGGGRYVYPAAPPKPRPFPDPVVADEIAPLVELLGAWAWRRPGLDEYLLLGWIGCALLGGAIDWRPLVWITGDRSTGKSTLHKLLRYLMGDGALVSVSDASAAGIWQKLGHASLPVAMDELEAEEDNRKAQASIKLARQAASGGVVLRGGSDHQGHEFVAQSCFLFSSILMPPLLGQDRSRMAILELQPLEDRAPLNLDAELWREMGLKLRRRLVQSWGRFAAVLELYRQALAQAGHGGRGADQFGALLAAADVLCHDREPSIADLATWGRKLKADALAETSDDAADHERCLQHLMTAIIEPYRSGGRATMADWIAKAAGRFPDGESHELVMDRPRRRIEAARVIETYGLKIMEDDLAVANYHQGLSEVFASTHWAGRSGTMGVWVQALRRAPGARATSNGLRFAGALLRSTMIPLAVLLDDPPPPVAVALEEGFDDLPV